MDEEYNHWMRIKEFYLGRRIWVTVELSHWNTWNFTLVLKLWRCSAHTIGFDLFGYTFRIVAYYA